MDHENGTSATFSDAVGKPVAKPPVTKLASPIELLNPDRYEFYTFDESGDLVKRLMTLQEIKAIIATSGDDVFDIDNLDIMPEKKVNDIVSNVQNVLREELESHKLPDTNHLFDTPDVSDSWSMILPAIFGNSGDDIRPESIAVGSTPETIILHPTQTETTTRKNPTTPKLPSFDDFLESVKTRNPVTTQSPYTRSSSTTIRQTRPSTTKPPLAYSETTTQGSTSSTQESTTIKVQIFPNSNTNNLEEPYNKFSTSSTTSSEDHASTRTQKPSLSMESRISSLTLDQTSPTYFTTTEKKSSSPTTQTTEETSRIVTTSSPKPSTSTTEDFKTSESRTSAISFKNTSPSLPTTTKQISSTSSSTTSKPVTQQTEKIYILVRPVSSSPSVQTTTKRIQTTQKQTPSEKPSTPQAIFTVSSEKPAIFTIAQKSSLPTKLETKSTKPTEIISTTEYNTRRQDVDETSPLTSSTYPFTEFLSYFTASEIPSSTKSNITLPTLAEILNNKIDTPASSSSTEYPPFSTSRSVSSDTSSQKITTISDEFLEQTSDDSTDKTATYFTNLETTFYKTEPNTEEPTTEKLQITDDNFNMTKDILQQFLLSSTNVYEINSAINAAATDSFESTLIPEDFTSTQKTNDYNQTLFESFSSLLAQAVNNVNEVIVEQNNTTPSATTFAVLSDSPTKVFEATTSNLNDSTISVDTTYNTDGTTEFLITVPSEANVKSKNPVKENIEYVNVPLFGKRNSSKPAKADLSLEMDYDLLDFNHTEMHKIQNKFNDNPDTNPQNKLTTVDDSYKTSTEANTPSDLDEPTSTTEDDLYTSTKYLETTRLEDAETELTEQDQVTQTTFIPTTTTTKIETSSAASSRITTKEKDTWTLVSTIAPHNKISVSESKPTLAPFLEPTPTVDLSVQPMQGFGLEESTSNLEYDVYQFIQLCNELAFGFWKSVTTGISTARSVVVSPFAATSLLAMVFLGARGATSGEMNEILKLDNMVTFNPHLIFKTITESISTGADSGIATSALVRQLYSDKSRESILNFYKERARFFYDGHVEEVSFKDIGDTIRRRTNLLVKKQTNGKLQEFLKDGSVRVRSPLAAVSASVMQVSKCLL